MLKLHSKRPEKISLGLPEGEPSGFMPLSEVFPLTVPFLDLPHPLLKDLQPNTPAPKPATAAPWVSKARPVVAVDLGPKAEAPATKAKGTWGQGPPASVIRKGAEIPITVGKKISPTKSPQLAEGK